MNKIKKNKRGLSLAEISILVIAGVILMAAGVTHAWLKNSQVEVVREMDRTQRRISDHDDSINSLQVKVDKKLNIYQLRDDLQRGQSELTVVPVSVIEKITPYIRPKTPDSPASVAQRHP